jgi:diaminopimelate decarboxylase
VVMTAAPWWVRPGLDVDGTGRLRVAGRDAASLAREHGTPLFVYDLARFGENARRLQAALAGTGLPSRVRLALKANPFPEVLAVFRGLGASGTPESVGIDACSPGEVERAIACGWRPDEISYTGTNVSDRDFAAILRHGVHVNLDALSQIERYGRLAPGTTIGVRIDPGTGAGYNEHLEYAGDRPTKFGIGLDRLDDAVAAAARHDLAIDTVHFHAGSGWLAGVCRASRPRSSARSPPSASCGRRATPSSRSTSAAGWECPPASTSVASTSTRTPPSSPGISDRSA